MHTRDWPAPSLVEVEVPEQKRRDLWELIVEQEEETCREEK